MLNKLQHKKNKMQGFTIVELIVVLAILGILIAIAVPMYTKYINNGKTTEATTTANAINNAVIQTLFDKNNEPTFSITSSTSEFEEIITLSKLESTETLEFLFYSSNSDLPTIENFQQKENTWVVYLPQDSTDNTFDFEKDVVVYSPTSYEPMMFINGVLSE